MTFRPPVMGTRHMIAAGHYLATTAGHNVLQAGGNAIDAGVAAGITLAVVQPDLVNFAGVAPIIIYSADDRCAATISGLGPWPKALNPTLFMQEHGGTIPEGILRTVVPAAPDAWIQALLRWGTWSFGAVAQEAIRFAEEGFVVYELMASIIAKHEDDYRQFPSSAAIFLPDGHVPRVGDVFRQRDLARTLRYMADEEAAHSRNGREAGLRAARDAFYAGDIAREIIRFQKDNGGFLREDDLKDYQSEVEQPLSIRFGDTIVYSCGPWCQGPSLLQALSLLDPNSLGSMEHNSAEYLHVITEAVKLAFADREEYFGDPRFVDVPMQALLSEEYAAQRRQLIRKDRAWPEMPPAGRQGREPRPARQDPSLNIDGGSPQPSLDTSYVSVVDRHGNVFSATPSDASYHAPVVPGTGLIPSPRGGQSWADPNHPSGVAPGKRPRLTPNPALAITPGRMVMPFGSPGGDVQTQAMLQVFLNVNVFGMNPQAAVEAPRVASYSYPSSFDPHPYYPGRLRVEGRIDGETADALGRLGHVIERWPDWTWLAGGVCTIVGHPETGVLVAGADPRRPSCAIGA